MKIAKSPMAISLSVFLAAGLLSACSSTAEPSGPKAPLCYAAHDVDKGATIKDDDIVENMVDPQQIPGDAASKSELVGKKLDTKIEQAQIISLRDIGEELTPELLTKLTWQKPSPTEKQTVAVVVTLKDIAKNAPFVEADCQKVEIAASSVPMDALTEIGLVRGHTSKFAIKKGEILMQHEMLSVQH